MIILRNNRFKKKVRILPQPIKKALASRLRLFVASPFQDLLNNHALVGPRSGERSINITGDWRLIFEEAGPDTIRLIDIDTHHNLYGT